MGPELALVLMAVGTTASAIGQIQAGNRAKRAGDFNAQVAANNAIASRASAEEDARRFRRVARKRAGERIVSGVSMDLLQDNAMEEELGALTILHKREITAIGYETDAAIARAGGRTAQRAGYSGAVSDLLLGGSKMASKFEGPITDLKLSS